MLIAPKSVKPEDIVNSNRKKWRYFFVGLVILIAGAVGWVIVSGIIAFNNISAKNLSDLPAFFRGLSPDELQEGDTRINILLLGTDAAASLTDSIQIFSIDPINKTIATLSVPRDLYVDNLMGKKTKINEVYNAGAKACRNNSKCDRDVDHGAESLKRVINQVLGINIHYFARFDFKGFKTIVNSIGGVTVTVERALSDPSYPCEHDPGLACGYYQNAGVINMNGDQALKYARCRSGNCNNDFGRSQRQQQLIVAIKNKALSAGVLSNPRKLSNLINAIGHSLRTDIKLDELQKLLQLINDIDQAKITYTVLDNAADSPLKNSVNSNGQYILLPKAGINKWDEVKDFVLAALPEPYIIKEAATIAIIYASGDTNDKAAAQNLAVKLKKFGYNITAIKANGSGKTETIEYFNNKPYTTTFLAKRLNYKIKAGAKTTGENQFDIVIHL